MTRSKLDNNLYVHLKSTISKALPLEYAIRAAQQTHAAELQKLAEIDKKIRQYWIDLGATEPEIDAEQLMDFAWDMIQVGYQLTHRHGRLYPLEMRQLMDKGLAEMSKMFRAEALPFLMPATAYFRVADLLRGNNILYMLNAVVKALTDSRAYKATSSIDLSKFVRGVREPVHLHPGMVYAVSERPKKGRAVECFGLLLDTEIEFSMPDLKRQVNEFLYQYAARRKTLRSTLAQDAIADALINEYLEHDLQGDKKAEQVKRLDGFISILSGLYCWDQRLIHHQVKARGALAAAFRDTDSIYPMGKGITKVGPAAIKKNYYATEKKILSVTELFASL